MAKFFVFIILLLFSSINSYALETADSADLSIKKISELIGYKGEYNANTKIYKIIVPRNDLKVAMRGMQITPDMGLVSWIEFKKTGDVTSIKGDLLLLQDQVNPVMSVALTNGLQVMRLRNPYLWDSPRVTLMHLKGEGNELKLAKAVKQLFDKIKMTTNEENDFPLGTSDLLETTLNPRKIDAILGVHAQFKNGVYRVEFSEKINSTQEDVSKEILKNSWATFSGSDTDTVMEGSLVLPESELQKVLLKLRHEQFYVLAIYQHVVDDVKGYVSISFWGVGDIKKLAGALHDIFLVAQGAASISASPRESTVNDSKKPAVSQSLQLSLEQAHPEWNVNVKGSSELRLKVFTLLGLAEATASEQIEALANVFSHNIKKLPLGKVAENVKVKNAEGSHLRMFTFRRLAQASAAEQIEALANVFKDTKKLPLIKAAQNMNVENAEKAHLRMFTLGGLAQASATEQIEALASVFQDIKKLPLVKVAQNTNAGKKETHSSMLTLRRLAQASAAQQIEALANVFQGIKELPLIKAIQNRSIGNVEEVHLKLFALRGLAQASAAEQIEALASIFQDIKKLSLVKAAQNTKVGKKETHSRMLTLRGLAQAIATEQIEALAGVFQDIKKLRLVAAISSDYFKLF